MHHSFLTHSFTDGHIGCFQHSAIVDYAAVNIGVHRFFWIGVSGFLNTSHDTIKFLEKNIGRKISDIPCSSIFTNMSPRERERKERINKWDFIKFKSTAKESNKIKRKPTIWENILANDTSDKGLISKIYKELTQLHSRKTKNPIKTWTKDLTRHLSKKDVERSQRHMKGCSASLVIREMQIKTTQWDTASHQLEWPPETNQQTVSASEVVEKRES